MQRQRAGLWRQAGRGSQHGWGAMQQSAITRATKCGPFSSELVTQYAWFGAEGLNSQPTDRSAIRIVRRRLRRLGLRTKALRDARIGIYSLSFDSLIHHALAHAGIAASLRSLGLVDVQRLLTTVAAGATVVGSICLHLQRDCNQAKHKPGNHKPDWHRPGPTQSMVRGHGVSQRLMRRTIMPQSRAAGSTDAP
jgi:hypothetical protein